MRQFKRLAWASTRCVAVVCFTADQDTDIRQVVLVHCCWLWVVLVSGALYLSTDPLIFVHINRDNLWPIVTGLIYTPVVNEFNFQGPFLKLGQNIGLLVGAAFWGVASDVWGRRWCFNLTLLITGVFAVAAGASPNYIALCSLAAVWSIGVGGNLPVDSAVFLGTYRRRSSTERDI